MLSPKSQFLPTPEQAGSLFYTFWAKPLPREKGFLDQEKTINPVGNTLFWAVTQSNASASIGFAVLLRKTDGREISQIYEVSSRGVIL